MLYLEPLRRRMQVKVDDRLIADSEDIVLLHEPGRFPVAYFPLSDIAPEVLEPCAHVSTHGGLGTTMWYSVRTGEKRVDRGAWQHTDVPDRADALCKRVAFSWPAVDTLYESWRAIDDVGRESRSRRRVPSRSRS